MKPLVNLIVADIALLLKTLRWGFEVVRKGNSGGEGISKRLHFCVASPAAIGFYTASRYGLLYLPDALIPHRLRPCKIQRYFD